ncbi:MAG: DUF4372 domain-containing protein, partial [Rikenellaceae bacterium]
MVCNFVAINLAKVMNSGKYIFTQVVSFVNRYEFEKCVYRYNGDFRTRE